jgi:hypothetical protein
LILRAAEAEDQKENKRQQNQTNRKTNTLSEALCHVDAKNYSGNEVHERNEHQDHPPAGPARDLA